MFGFLHSLRGMNTHATETTELKEPRGIKEVKDFREPVAKDSSRRILLIEDEDRLLEHLSQLLREGGFEVSAHSSIEELERIADRPEEPFDLLLLDRMMDGKDTADLFERLKSSLPLSKILVLSAIDTSAEKIRLLDLGADDYLAKPFDSQELLARVKALLRRDRVNLQFGNITLNSESRTINVDGQEFSLPNKEFVLLRTLLQIPGRVYSKGFLYQQVWDMKSDVESNVVETTVNKLRRRLTEAGARISIRNARSSGYWVEE